jgi:hypothetical protein
MAQGIGKDANSQFPGATPHDSPSICPVHISRPAEHALLPGVAQSNNPDLADHRRPPDQSGALRQIVSGEFRTMRLSS